MQSLYSDRKTMRSSWNLPDSRCKLSRAVITLGNLKHSGIVFSQLRKQKNSSYLLRMFVVQTERVIKISLSCFSAHVIDKPICTTSSLRLPDDSVTVPQQGAKFLFMLTDSALREKVLLISFILFILFGSCRCLSSCKNVSCCFIYWFSLMENCPYSNVWKLRYLFGYYITLIPY